MGLTIAITVTCFAAFGLLAAITQAVVAALIGYRMKINVEAFESQIEKLLMANNIDRAIKLCNAVPDSLVARAVKTMLVRANHGQTERAAAYEEAASSLEPAYNMLARFRRRQVVYHMTTMLVAFATMLLATYGTALLWPQIVVVSCFVCSIAPLWYAASSYDGTLLNIERGNEVVVKIHNIIEQRSKGLEHG